MNRAMLQRPSTHASTDAGYARLQRQCDCGARLSAAGATCDKCRKAQPGTDLQARLVVGASSDPLEYEADRAAAQVLSMSAVTHGTLRRSGLPQLSRRASSAASGATQAPATVDAALRTRGEPMADGLREFFEPRFGHDFSRVRIHRDATAAASASDVAAQAYTVGQHIVFGSGRFAPEDGAGRMLLAHELAHVVQQQGAAALLQRDDDEARRKKQATERDRARKRLEAWAAGQTPRPATDPADSDFAFTAQKLAHEITHKPDPASFELLDKPKNAAQLANWTTAFRDAYQLALMILDSQGTTQRETRAALIATDLGHAGFTTEAMDVAGKLPDDDRETVYEALAKSPEQLSAGQIGTLSRFFSARAASPDKHPLLAALTDRSGAFAKRLGKDRLLAALEPTLARYRKNSDYLDVLAELLVFDAASRVPVSEWLWKADKEYLFELLSSPYFGEPGYKVTQFADSEGVAREMTLEGDLPWVYTYKQKFYVDHLVRLGARHAIDIKSPASMRTTALKAWLDAETEDIGAALAAEHPDAPEKITAAYRHIADIFFFHVDRGDVVPDRAGKLAHLGVDAPRNMRLKADCDVLATYATRLLRSAGFTPVGYLAVEPDVEPSHAVALLKKALPVQEPAPGEAAEQAPDRHYIVNNKQVTPIDARSKEAAIKAARNDALGVYDPEPDRFKVYYEDAAANGAMTRDLWTTEEKLRRKDLGKDTPARANTP